MSQNKKMIKMTKKMKLKDHRLIVDNQVGIEVDQEVLPDRN